MNVLGAEVEEEGLFAVLLDEGPGLLHEHVGHGLVVPQGLAAALHVSNAADAIDDAVVVAVGAGIVGHGFGIQLAVRVGRAGSAVIHGLLVGDGYGIVRVQTDDAAVLQEDARHTVVGGGQEEGVVEADIPGPGLHHAIPVDGAGTESKVPLADHARAVSCLLEEVAQGKLFRVDGHVCVARQDARALLAKGHLAGQQGVAGRRARRRRAVGVGEAKPLRSHTVEIGRGDQFGPVGADVAVAHVVAVDENHVRAARGLGASRASAQPLGRHRRKGTGKKLPAVHAHLSSLVHLMLAVWPHPQGGA